MTIVGGSIMLLGGFSSVETWHCLKQKKDKKRVLQGIVRLKINNYFITYSPSRHFGTVQLSFLFNFFCGMQKVIIQLIFILIISEFNTTANNAKKINN